MKGKLHIESHGTEAMVEIEGRVTDIIFNYLTLTSEVCRKLGIPPLALAAALPKLLYDYRSTALKSATNIDLSALRRQMGGADR